MVLYKGTWWQVFLNMLKRTENEVHQWNGFISNLPSCPETRILFPLQKAPPPLVAVYISSTIGL